MKASWDDDSTKRGVYWYEGNLRGNATKILGSVFAADKGGWSSYVNNGGKWLDAVEFETLDEAKLYVEAIVALEHGI